MRWNGKGKEYNDLDLLLYTIFLSNRRLESGKSKEKLDKGKILFDGEYKNGRWNGIGKEYYENGNLRYEGEFLDGRWNGNGKEYYQNGELKYDGEFLNGQKKN